ncbi:hypothetical protein [Novipirellula maiorica]|uniref:hypothetical protein n=1 Tax=Novipirellula maiorica TaxID=1265734 RepID=UPI000347F16F|nr:hypothetical protein [Rhodopirellula maiorica]
MRVVGPLIESSPSIVIALHDDSLHVDQTLANRDRARPEPFWFNVESGLDSDSIPQLLKKLIF